MKNLTKGSRFTEDGQEKVERKLSMMREPIEFIYFSEVEEQSFRNEAGREFFAALFTHAFESTLFGVTDEDYMINYWDLTRIVAFDICDRNRKAVSLSLKANFSGVSLFMGEADTNLFDRKTALLSAERIGTKCSDPLLITFLRRLARFRNPSIS